MQTKFEQVPFSQLNCHQLFSICDELVDSATADAVHYCFTTTFKDSIYKHLLKVVIKQELQQMIDQNADDWKRVVLFQKLAPLRQTFVERKLLSQPQTLSTATVTATPLPIASTLTSSRPSRQRFSMKSAAATVALKSRSTHRNHNHNHNLRAAEAPRVVHEVCARQNGIPLLDKATTPSPSKERKRERATKSTSAASPVMPEEGSSNTNSNSGNSNSNEAAVAQDEASGAVTATGPAGPPLKKRKRTFSKYDDFVVVLQKLENKHDSRLLKCLRYTNDGVICDTCSADSKLSGYFTREKPCKDFNFNKISSHILTTKHYMRLDPTSKQLHPHHKSPAASQQEQLIREVLVFHPQGPQQTYDDVLVTVPVTLSHTSSTSTADEYHDFNSASVVVSKQETDS